MALLALTLLVSGLCVPGSAREDEGVLSLDLTAQEARSPIHHSAKVSQQRQLQQDNDDDPFTQSYDYVYNNDDAPSGPEGDSPPPEPTEDAEEDAADAPAEPPPADEAQGPDPPPSNAGSPASDQDAPSTPAPEPTSMSNGTSQDTAPSPASQPQSDSPSETLAPSPAAAPNASSAGNSASPAPASPPPPPAQPRATPISVPAANITAVYTAAELQRAFRNGARDVEVRGHLDLRGMAPYLNPGFEGWNTSDPNRTHLAYQVVPTRSLRGNCADTGSESKAFVEALKATTQGRVEYPPLKPYQCLLVTDQTFLMAINGTFWMDNLYFAIARSIVNPSLTIFQHGLTVPGFFESGSQTWGQEVYVTNATFVGEGRGSARAVAAESIGASVLFEDCVFSSFTGDFAPLLFLRRSFGIFRKTVFRDIYIREELFDVSRGSTVRLEDCSFANITVPGDLYVSTSDSDYSDFGGDGYSTAIYYPADEQRLPFLDIERVPALRNSGFDAHTVNDTKSDCLYRFDELPADCSEQSAYYQKVLQERQAAARGPAAPGSGAFVTGYFDGYSGAAPGEAVPDEVDYSEDYGYTGGYVDPPEEDLQGMFLTLEDEWFVRTRAVLPQRGPPPAGFSQLFAALVKDAPEDERQPMPSPLERNVAPPQVAFPEATGSSSSDSTDDVAGIVAASVVALLLVVLAALVYKCWHPAATAAAPLETKRSRGSGMGAIGAGDEVSAALVAKTIALAHRVPLVDNELISTAAPDMVSSKTAPSDSKTTSSSHLHTRGPPFPTETTASSGSMLAQPAHPSERAGAGGGASGSGGAGGGGGDGGGSGGDSQSQAQAHLELEQRERSGHPGRSLTDELTQQTSLTQDVTGTSDHGFHAHTTSSTSEFEAQARIMNRASSESRRLITPSAMNDEFEFRLPTGVALVSAARPITSAITIDTESHTPHTTTSSAPVTIGPRHRHIWHVPTNLASASTQEDSADLATCGHAAGRPAPGQLARLVDESLRKDGQTMHGDLHTSTVATRAPEPVVGITDTDTMMYGSRLVELGKQLDIFRGSGLGDAGSLLLGRFVVLGRSERRQGGQGMVQFVTGATDGLSYAVKFFLDEDSFQAEASLYRACFPHLANRTPTAIDLPFRALGDLPATGSGNRGSSGGGGSNGGGNSGSGSGSGARDQRSQQLAEAARRFMPQVELVCSTGDALLRDPSGGLLPPCIVIERGESLQEWSNRAEPDLFTSIAVLSNVAQRMGDMHAAGYAHRDLKPANVMWLPRENRWTVIDFGCAARIGESVPLSFTLAYAAPEVVRAYLLEEREIQSVEALDAWSLGVMAFELLTGAPAFHLLSDGRCRVLAQLRGDLPLPWEPGHADQASRMRKLGMLRQPVCRLLQRTPGHRISMTEFHRACTRIFISHTSQEP